MAEYLNHEGYPGPTAYYAISEIEREERQRAYRPLVYVCSPYSGDVEYNAEQARKYSRYVVDRHGIPITPHLLFPQFMSDRKLALKFDKVLIGKCEQIWVFGDEITKGMYREINAAKRMHKKVRYFTKDLMEVMK